MASESMFRPGLSSMDVAASVHPLLRPASAGRLAAAGAAATSILLLTLASLLTGCGAGNFESIAPVAPAAGPVMHVSGAVHGGQQPISSAVVQLWQVGTAGYGLGAAPLGASTSTDVGGNFSITGAYDCKNAANGASTLVYITAAGGNPGLGTSTNNQAILLMSALGTCGSLTASTFVSINEVSTVGSVYALAQFMSPAGGVGSYASSMVGLKNAFSMVGNLVDNRTGSARTATLAGNGVVPQARINTLADVLAPCINSSGSSASQCSGLFAATTAGGVVPSNTVAALLNIALNPASNVQQIYNLQDSRSPFQPTLTSVNDWTMTVGYDAGGSNASGLAIDSGGNAWVANLGAASGSGGTASSVSLLSPTGAPAANSPFASATLVNGAAAIAIDPADNAWVANRDGNSAAELTGAGGSIASVAGPFTGNGISAPNALAIDANANVFLVNSGNSSVTELNHANYAAGAMNFSSIGLNGPQGIAIDPFGFAFIANSTGGSVTVLNPSVPTSAANSFVSYTTAGLANPGTVALDGLANLYLADASAGAVAVLNHSGGPISASGGYTGAGLSGVGTGTSSEAIDGRGNVWVVDRTGNHVSELTSAGAAVSPATGFQDGTFQTPSAIAIDGSGNVWIANANPVRSGGRALSLSQIVGAAVPVVVPLSLAVKQAKIAFRPGTAQPSAIVAGPLTGTVGTPVQFNASGSSDPGGKALTYTINFGDGTSASGATAAHTYTAAGTYSVTVAATNSDGITGITATTATIAGAVVTNPVVSAGGPYTGIAGLAVSFNGTGSSDPSNRGGGPYALTYTWDFGDGSQGFGPTPTHAYAASGTYTVKLTAQTASGGNASATTSATIADNSVQSQLPTANPGGPYTGVAGTAVAFDGSKSSDPNALALTYHWDFGDGNSTDGSSKITHVYRAAGTFTVSLYVFNGSYGNSGSTTTKISAAAVAPLVANAGGPYTVAVNQPLTVDGTKSTNPQQHQLSYSWNFGDGGTRTGAQPTYIYSAQGKFTITLTVSDNAGMTSAATAQVTVGGPAVETIKASAGGPYADTTGHAIIFDASASVDNLSNPLTFTWDFGDGSNGTGSMPSHTYAGPGTFTATVTANSGSVSSTATASVVITPSVKVTITSPAPSALFGTNTVTVTGTTSTSNPTVTVNGIPASVSGTGFTATGVSLREGVNLITATAQDPSGGVGTGNVSVILDATAPTISITSPAVGSIVSSPSINVAGLVSDVVTGTIGSNDVSVTVNGVQAQVLNRSYLANSVQLVPGINKIVVVATDKVNHSGTSTVTVQYAPPVQQLSLVSLSGDGQSGPVGSLLAQPLVVQLRAADGTPVVGRPITFTVTRSDGMVQMMPTIAQTVSATTDNKGKASVLFQVGNRAGLGVNQVAASTPGASGAVLFTASSTSTTATQIHAVRGENQRGLLGGALPEAFQVIVTDAHNNPIPGVPVTFTSTMGDGTLAASGATSDANGKASTSLTLGQQEGVGNYMVSADFAGDTGAPIIFAASGFAPGPVAKTSVSGTVLDNANTPIPNATVRLLGTSLSAVSDVNGRFQIDQAPAGTVTLSVDGSTSTRPETFPFLSFVLEDLPGQNNTLGKPIYLPAIDVNNSQTVGGDDPVTLTMKNVPGVAFTIAPHSVTFPDGSTVGKLSLSQVRSDMVPMAPVNGSAPDLIWTLQPAGARFSVPVQVTLPNTQALPPGTVAEFYQYDHDLEQFVTAGTMHVAADGSVMVSDPGFGLTKAGWGHGQPPSTQNTCTVSCYNYNECTTVSAFNCGCSSRNLTGGSCGGNAKTATCKLSGRCQNGICIGPNAPDGTVCDDGVFCTDPDSCKTGVCYGKPIDPVNITGGQSPVALKFENAFKSGLDPLKVFINTYGFLGEIEPTLSADLTEARTCCEAKKILDSVQDKTSITVGVKVTFGPIFPPNASISVPYVGAVGLYFTISVSGGFTGAWSTDNCADTDCVGGDAKIEGNVEVGLGGAIYNRFIGTYIVTGGANAGINANIAIYCHVLKATYGISDTKLVATFRNKSTGRTYSAEKVIFAGVTLGSSPDLPFGAF